MALTTLSASMDIIVGLSRYPNTNEGITYQQLQAKFDEGNNTLKTHINTVLIPEIDTLESSNTASILFLTTSVSALNTSVSVLAIADGQGVKITGDQLITGTKTFINTPQTPNMGTASGTSSVTNKSYVDEVVAANKSYVDEVVANIYAGGIADDSLGTSKMAAEQKRGATNGVASLVGGQVPLSQLDNVDVSSAINRKFAIMKLGGI